MTKKNYAKYLFLGFAFSHETECHHPWMISCPKSSHSSRPSQFHAINITADAAQEKYIHIFRNLGDTIKTA